jgi:hypothetical protein
MRQLETRLTELEAHRPVFGLPVAQMTDKELVFILTGSRLSTITDAELERIIAAEAVGNQGSRGAQVG